MKIKYVVIASHKDDQSAVHIMKKLKQMRQPAKLVNFGEFPGAISSTISVSNNSALSVNLHRNGFSFTEDSVKSIWWRRPQGPVKNTRASLLGSYIRNESDIVLATSL